MNIVALLTWFLASTGLIGPGCVVDPVQQELVCEAPTPSESARRGAPPPPSEEAETPSLPKPPPGRTLWDNSARISNGF